MSSIKRERKRRVCQSTGLFINECVCRWAYTRKNCGFSTQKEQKKRAMPTVFGRGGKQIAKKTSWKRIQKK